MTAHAIGIEKVALRGIGDHIENVFYFVGGRRRSDKNIGGSVADAVCNR
jgi:hypothetical protein